jgi:hypothetical protein
MTDNPNPPYAAFAIVVGSLDGQNKIALMSMSRDPGAIFWVEPDYARALANNLNMLADHLDPPKKEWRVVEQTNTPEVLIDHVRSIIRTKRKSRRSNHKPRKAKR